MRKIVALSTLGACLAQLCAPSLPALEFRAEIDASWVKNLSRTSFAPSRKSAAAYAATITALQARPLTREWQLFLSGEAGANWVPKFTGLDSLHGGLHAQLRRKFGLGPLAPVLDFHGGLTGCAVREGGRSGWQAGAGLTLSRRLTEFWRVAAGGEWEKYFASHQAFEVDHRSLSLESTWDLSERWQLGLGARRLWGQLTANARYDIYDTALDGGFGPAIANYYNRIPWEISNTFGPGWVAYRIDCDADFWWVQLTVTLGPNTSLPLRYETVKVINRVGVRYDTDLWSLGLVHRF